MSAQYEGMVKRVQHAFAARNGLFGALLARTGYVGIKKIFERPYGGFLAMFAAGKIHLSVYMSSSLISAPFGTPLRSTSSYTPVLVAATVRLSVWQGCKRPIPTASHLPP